jgi:hypothetical protein
MIALRDDQYGEAPELATALPAFVARLGLELADGPPRVHGG